MLRQEKKRFASKSFQILHSHQTSFQAHYYIMSSTLREIHFLRHNFSIIQNEYYYLNFNIDKNEKKFHTILTINENLNKLEEKLSKEKRKEIFKNLKDLAEIGYTETFEKTSEYSIHLFNIFTRFLFVTEHGRK